MAGASASGRPRPDAVLVEIADYLHGAPIESPEAWETARHALIDSLGCALRALEFPACTRLLGPVVPGAEMPGGARVPGTPYRLDPVRAAFNLGALIRWLDFNDTWLAAEWGHPSDNFGGILSLADWLSRRAVAEGRPPLTMRNVLDAAIRAYEIQGCLALENAFNAVGLDHVILVKVASTAAACLLLGLSRNQTVDALSQAWIDGHSLRTYRHAPNTGSRKSWAAGDATSRGIWLALLTQRGELGYPTALTAPTWGFYDVHLGGQPLRFQRRYGSYVMENVLFKIAFPAEFHAQTAVECALALHPRVVDRLDRVRRIRIRTQAAAMRIIAKDGPLHNPADRDHCLQYMVAVPLIHGRLTAADYEDTAAADPRIDALRGLMVCVEEPAFSREYHDPEKRSIANAVEVEFENGERIETMIEYPVGHRRRRAEGIPLLLEKFRGSLTPRFSPEQQQQILAVSLDSDRLQSMAVHAYMDLF